MIPFNKATKLGAEQSCLETAISSGDICGDGTFGKRCEAALAKYLGPESHVLLTPSGTHALEAIPLLLDLQAGDEVIVPSYTFVSVAQSFSRMGARPIFADVEPRSLNIDPTSVLERLSGKTRAMVCVHYGGVPCALEELKRIADQNRIVLLEDAAHALGASYNGRPLGTFGRLATFSFHERKNITCGEGGALVVNDPNLVDRAHTIRNKGTNRRAFNRGEVEFYTWVESGSSYVLSDLLAAYLLPQLKEIDSVTERRRALSFNYQSLLSPLEERGLIELPHPKDAEHSSAHIYYILLDSTETRQQLRDFLLRREIVTVSHYEPLHLSPYVIEHWGPQPSLPVTESIAPRLLRLPLFHSLEFAEQEQVAENIQRFFST